jgi:hypothetical protein
LDSISNQAEEAMRNWEMTQTDTIGAYTWDQAWKVRGIARQVLLAAAQLQGSTEMTQAVLAKGHSKAFGGKKGRRDGITSAFVAASGAGVVDQVAYYLTHKAEALEAPFQPLNLALPPFVSGAEEEALVPVIPAWHQALVAALRNDRADCAKMIQRHFMPSPGDIDVHFLREDDGRAPTHYRDAFEAYVESRFVPDVHHCRWVDAAFELAGPASHTAKRLRR